MKSLSPLRSTRIQALAYLSFALAFPIGVSAYISRATEFSTGTRTWLVVLVNSVWVGAIAAGAFFGYRRGRMRRAARMSVEARGMAESDVPSKAVAILWMALVSRMTLAVAVIAMGFGIPHAGWITVGAFALNLGGLVAAKPSKLNEIET